MKITLGITFWTPCICCGISVCNKFRGLVDALQTLVGECSVH